MLVVRPAGLADFDSLMELAVLSGRGFTSLPEDEPTLRARLALSEASFQSGVAPPEAWYTLMLEDLDTGSVEGVAGVKAGVGVKRPFFSFRVVTLAQSSPTLEMRFDHKALVLVNECAGWSEVGSLFLRPEKRKGGAGRLLAQSRYMLIGIEPQRFAEMVLAELRGWFDEDGRCPFWEHVAHKFFRLGFDQADLMSASTDGQFILDLAPRHPIYTELLPEEARDVIGRVHRDGEAARAMLEREGFRYQGLVDLFDAGPTVACPRDDIRTVRDSKRLRVKLGEDAFGEEALISTGDVARFRAIRAPVLIDGDAAILGREALDALGVCEGEVVRVKA
ncbi:arginine N-succinyltransferase [Caulobacter segnis]|uniref:Arginine/ornithine succinyltransferase subunit n=2 Tax=Caulobacter segnis TaxID=88688 RepID=D5VKN1_CAUST|nr:arginine N-succinyltransferase [Caulobacter segnis]ADG11054.1 arginine/ornithine succinyltransferase subunit [Caulobacter segnis ATCC 21756]AVQ02743.1 arginine N-succinyltransferase [Caulobacter segnis]